MQPCQLCRLVDLRFIEKDRQDCAVIDMSIYFTQLVSQSHHHGLELSWLQVFRNVHEKDEVSVGSVVIDLCQHTLGDCRRTVAEQFKPKKFKQNNKIFLIFKSF